MNTKLTKNDLSKLLGLYAPEAYSKIILLINEINEICVFAYEPPPNIQDRAQLTNLESKLIEKAVQLRKNNWYSFLEILLELAAKANFPTKGIIDAVYFHQSHPEKRIYLKKDDIENGKLIKICSNASFKTPFALSSKVRTNTKAQMHIPVLDFHVEKTKSTLDMAFLILEKLVDDPFLIMETERSYHAIIIGLMSGSQLNRFLSKCLLFSPITDHAYIAHQLIECESAIRLTKYKHNGASPKVIAVRNQK